MTRSVFKATEVSGLTTPTYDSEASNKKYVDDISGAIVTWVTSDYYPSGLGNSLNTSYTNHSGQTTAHYTSGSIKTWFDNVYAPTGAGGSPGGSDTQIQYNNGDEFGGISNFTYNDGNNNISFSGNMYISGTISSNTTLTVYADDIYGDVHYADILFKETWCDICGETFNEGDITTLIVKYVKDETGMVPVHLKCGLNRID